MSEKEWYGAPPDRCEICGKGLTMRFVDGATTMGPWAVMCFQCHMAHGVGVGPGRGQQYTQRPDGRWVQGSGRDEEA